MNIVFKTLEFIKPCLIFIMMILTLVSPYSLPNIMGFTAPTIYPEGWFKEIFGLIVPMMSPIEVELLTKYYSKAGIYFEWGSGTSTIYASQIIPKIYSVESDKPFHDVVKSLIPSYRDVKYLTIDLHGTMNLGYPVGATDKEIRNYYTAYKKEYNADLILIDARFRAACGLHLLDKINENTIVMIHDFPNRPKYHILLKYYNLIESADTLAILKKKTCCPTQSEFAQYEREVL